MTILSFRDLYTLKLVPLELPMSPEIELQGGFSESGKAFSIDL